MKIYEQTVTGSAAEIIEKFSAQEPKGEMVFMVAPPKEDEKGIAEIDVLSILRSKMDSLPLKTAVKEVVAQYGLNKNEVYALALQIKNQNQ